MFDPNRLYSFESEVGNFIHDVFDAAIRLNEYQVNQSLYGRAGSKLICRKISFFSTLGDCNVEGVYIGPSLRPLRLTEWGFLAISG